MTNRTNLFLVTLLISILSACSGAPNRGGDVAELPQDVPTEAPAPTPTIAPAAQPTEAPPTQPSPASTSQTEPATEAQPADEPVVAFRVEGGIAAFCDQLSIDVQGNYTLSICGQEDIVGTLDQPDRVSLQTWHENLADFQLTFQDNPGGPDNMIRELTFRGEGEVEADQTQQQVIFDWASGLNVRVRPQQAEVIPTPEPVQANPAGLCPDIARPALIMANYEQANMLTLVDPDSQATCEITLAQSPVGRVAAAAGNIYYPAFDPQAQTTTLWQLSVAGAESPLAFTTLSAEQPGPFDFIVSEDGGKIAWSQTIIDPEADPPTYRNNLWVANLDGSNQVTLLDGIENNEGRFVVPLRFAANGDTLYYTLQPDIGGPILSGRFDTLYSAPTEGGQSQLIYACPQENSVCIGGLSPDANILTIVQPAEGTIQILNRDGSLLNTLSLPATDYIERTAFAPNGNLAYVTATLSQASPDDPPLPDPAYLNYIAPPYTGQPEVVLSNNNIGTLRGWIDNNRLVIGVLDAEGNVGTFVVTLDGQLTELLASTENAPVGVLR